MKSFQKNAFVIDLNFHGTKQVTNSIAEEKSDGNIVIKNPTEELANLENKRISFFIPKALEGSSFHVGIQQRISFHDFLDNTHKHYIATDIISHQSSTIVVGGLIAEVFENLSPNYWSTTNIVTDTIHAALTKLDKEHCIIN